MADNDREIFEKLTKQGETLARIDERTERMDLEWKDSRADHETRLRHLEADNEKRKGIAAADGTEFEFPFEPPKPKTPAPTKSANVPARLAEARARRQAEKATTNIVTVVVTPDYTWDFNNPETMEKLDNLSREEVDALPPDVRRAYFYFDAERKTTNTVTVVVKPDK